jgi:undecaprenyl diphosphate synthase
VEWTKEHISPEKLPRHIAVIMDGNGRWAKKRGAARIFGHQNAVKAVREITEGCGELGIEYLTLYAFSTENWGRPKSEVDGLMQLLVSTLKAELDSLHKNKVRLTTIGNTDNLPESCRAELQEAMEATKENTGLNLIIALSYSGRWQIVDTVRKMAHDVAAGTLQPNEIDELMFESYMNPAHVPDPELLIRTSGEMRVSNFLLWQIAYTEIFITETLWPDFRKKDLYEALVSYQNRERRFGKISEQVNP